MRHIHETDHSACDRQDHLRRRETGEDCPLVRCLTCGLRPSCIRCGRPNGEVHTCLRNLGQTVTARNN